MGVWRNALHHIDQNACDIFRDELHGRVLRIEKTHGIYKEGVLINAAKGTENDVLTLHVHQADPLTHELIVLKFPLEKHLRLTIGEPGAIANDNSGLLTRWTIVGSSIRERGLLHMLYIREQENERDKASKKRTFANDLVLRRIDFTESYSR